MTIIILFLSGKPSEEIKIQGYFLHTPPQNNDSYFLNSKVSYEVISLCFLFLFPQLSLQEVLRGATELAEVGFPVAEVAAHHWAYWVSALKKAGKELGEDLLIDGHAPKFGQVFRNPALAQTLRVNPLSLHTHTHWHNTNKTHVRRSFKEN